MLRNSNLKIIFILAIISGGIFFFPASVLSDSLNESRTFFVDPSYNLKGRDKVDATLKEISQKGYFYIENGYYGNLTENEQEEISKSLDALAQEFDREIYPKLTSTYGSEWRPGIDNNYRLTILFHQMGRRAAGYFREEDEYLKIQSPNSNVREIIYLNIKYINEPIIKSYLAHEFTHLITFNQKDRIRGIAEEIWLNEARADYSPTLLGYDEYNNEYENNLQSRVKAFLANSSDSITSWENKASDYGALNLFTQYLIDHYGLKVLVDSLHSKKVGIPSLNEALGKNGFAEDFSQIFTDWTIAALVNDCSLNEKYCYKNSNLEDVYVIPSTNFLPLSGESTLSVNDRSQNWAGNWFKFVGGNGNLKIEFSGDSESLFRIPYVAQDTSGKYEIGFFELDEQQKGEIIVPEFRTKISSVTIIPSIQSKISGFNSAELFFPFSWQASTLRSETDNEKLIEQLLERIEFLKAQIAQIRAKIAAISVQRSSCQEFNQNLYFGMENSQIYCLQEFLKSQGEDIYPEGLVTGYFGPLTQAAVIHFQERFAEEILEPLNLSSGTGFVGPSTRDKINQMLNL